MAPIRKYFSKLFQIIKLYLVKRANIEDFKKKIIVMKITSIVAA